MKIGYTEGVTVPLLFFAVLVVLDGFKDVPGIVAIEIPSQARPVEKRKPEVVQAENAWLINDTGNLRPSTNCVPGGEWVHAVPVGSGCTGDIRLIDVANGICYVTPPRGTVKLDRYTCDE